MTNEFTYEVEFVVPDEVEEENVLLVLREFFGDLVQTNRFIDATVKVDDREEMGKGQQERLTKMVGDLSDEEIATALQVIESMQGDE